MLENVRRWFDGLPAAEKDIPLVSAAGVAYSPRMVLNEVSRGTYVGQQLQQMVEGRSFGSTSEEEYRLALIRLKAKLAEMPQNKPLVATMDPQGRAYTPKELLGEIEGGTPLGQRWIQGELLHMQKLMSG